MHENKQSRSGEEEIIITNRLGNRAENKGSLRPAIVSVIILCVGLFVLFAPIPTVHAHAALVEMEPAEGAVAKEAPSMLKLRFNEPIEHALATVTVYDSNGTPVYTGHPIGDRQ